MTYQDFKDAILMKVNESVPSTTQVQIQKIIKNNNIQLDGLLISENDCNIAPTIYLNYYYEKYIEGTSFDDVYYQIMQCYEKHRIDKEMDISFFTEFENAKHHITYKLINYEKNKELLATIPHIPYLDLAIVFCCTLNISNDNNASILIHTSHMDFWEITTNELLTLATTNTPKLLHYELRDMEDLIDELLPLESEEVPSNANHSIRMFVLTNHLKQHGACCILYKNLLQEFAKKVNSDLFILPSSIHEVLLVPAENVDYREELTSMVEEVNRTQVAEEEILSNHVYYYSKSLDTITL